MLTVDDGTEILHVADIVIVRPAIGTNLGDNLIPQPRENVRVRRKKVEDECQRSGSGVSASCKIQIYMSKRTPTASAIHMPIMMLRLTENIRTKRSKRSVR